jgi:hypothetical protein
VAGLLLVGALVAFLPFLISLSGRGGAWKFLCLLCCLLALLSAVSVVGGIVAWLLAWVFCAVAQSAGRTERRLARIERTARKSAAATSSPFIPDGVYGGVPYRVAANGTIDAVMQGSVVRFTNIDRLMDAVAGGVEPFSQVIDHPHQDEKKPRRFNSDIAVLITLAIIAIVIFFATKG